MRLPEEFRFHEGAFRDAIAASVSRGRIDGWLRYSPPTSASDSSQMDTDLIGQLGAWSESVRHLLPEVQPLRVELEVVAEGVLVVGTAVAARLLLALLTSS